MEDVGLLFYFLVIYINEIIYINEMCVCVSMSYIYGIHMCAYIYIYICMHICMPAIPALRR